MLYFLSHQNFQDLCASVWCRLSPHLTPGSTCLQESDCLIPQGTWKVPLQRLTKKTGRQNQKGKPVVSTLTLWTSNPHTPKTALGSLRTGSSGEGEAAKDSRGTQVLPCSTLYKLAWTVPESPRPPVFSQVLQVSSSSLLTRGLFREVYSTQSTVKCSQDLR